MTSYPPQPLDFQRGTILPKMDSSNLSQGIKRLSQVCGGVNHYCKLFPKRHFYLVTKIFRSQYWAYISLEMQRNRAHTHDNIRKGVIRRFFLVYKKCQTIDGECITEFTQPDASNPIQDISDLDFFNIDYRFLSNTIPQGSNVPGGTNVQGRGLVINPGDNNYTTSVSNLASNNASPNIWLASDSLAKSFYSTIMTDLGQTTATPNILLNETALQYFSQNFTTMQSFFINAVPGPANDSYDALKYQTGPLNNSVAVISTKYLCQVPRRKAKGTLFVSILVADLVFMQALWKLYSFLTVIWLEHKDPKGKREPYIGRDVLMELTLMIANHCSGCEQTRIPLASLGASDYEPERSRSLGPGIGRRGTRYSRPRIPLASLGASDYEPERSRSLGPGIGRRGTRYSRPRIPLASLGASDHEPERSRSLGPGIGRRGTRYSRPRIPLASLGASDHEPERSRSLGPGIGRRGTRYSRPRIPLASLGASDHEPERSRSLGPGIGRRGTRYSRPRIPLASLGASDHEPERSRSLEPGIGRRGTPYSRLESPGGNARVENDV